MTYLAYIKGCLSNIHIAGLKPDIFIFSTPRSGSTFLMELLYAQKGVKIFEPDLFLKSYELEKNSLKGTLLYMRLNVPPKRLNIYPYLE